MTTKKLDLFPAAFRLFAILLNIVASIHGLVVGVWASFVICGIVAVWLTLDTINKRELFYRDNP